MIRLAFLLSFAIFASGCGANIFGFDAPSSDAQLQAAARACLDNGDTTCALNYYNQMSSGSNDAKQAEGAFAALAAQGATFGAFLSSVGSAASMAALGRMANSLVSGAGSTKRLAIYNAYKRAATITDATQRNFVRFITSFALTAELLAETAAIGGTSTTTVTASDLATNANCFDQTATCGPANHGTTFSVCASPSTTAGLQDTPNTAIDLDSTDEATMGTTLPTLVMMNAAASKMNSSLSALGSSGSFGSFSSSSSGLAAIAIATLPNCFRFELLRLQAVPKQ